MLRKSVFKNLLRATETSNGLTNALMMFKVLCWNSLFPAVVAPAKGAGYAMTSDILGLLHSVASIATLEL
jgi:hypothetical protein